MVTRTVKFATALVMIGLMGCQSGLPVNMEINGRITKVHDGDSAHITPTGSKRVIVRLAAIDAPEIKQEHGIKSRDYLRGLILNREVVAYCNKLDKYRRQICKVTHKGTDINVEMLKGGQAWYYSRYRQEQTRSDQRIYKKAESLAKRAQLGLWKNTEAVAPWEFRSIVRQ